MWMRVAAVFYSSRIWETCCGRAEVSTYYLYETAGRVIISEPEICGNRWRSIV